MLSIKINAKSTAKIKRAPLSAFEVNEGSKQEECPELYSFKPKAPPPAPSSLFAASTKATEDEEIVRRLAGEFNEEVINDEGKVEGVLDGEDAQDDVDLYEQGKFKMSKIDSHKAGLIKLRPRTAKTASPEPEGPRYVDKLIKSATLRDAEREIIHEAKLVKDIEKEIAEKGGAQPKAYVTSGYKRRLQERQQAAQQLAERESAGDKRSAADFQRSLITRVYAEDDNTHHS